MKFVPEGKREPMEKSNNQKGEAKIYYVVLGILLAIGVFFAVKNYQDHRNDITIHLPKVDVR